MLYLLLIALVSLCVFWKLWYKKSPLEPPELPGWLPIVGHAHKIMGNSERKYTQQVFDTGGVMNTACTVRFTAKQVRKVLQNMTREMLKGIMKIGEECAEKGGVVTFYFGFRKAYGITDPEDSVTIMNACLQKHFFYDFGKPLLGEGLLTADVSIWKKTRKLLNPAFNQQVLDGFIEVFNDQAERLVEQFDKEVGKPFDQEQLLRVNNLETICSTSLGVYGPDSEYSAMFSQYLPRLASLIHALNERVKKFWLHSDFIYNMTRGKKQLNEEIKHLTSLSKLIIEKKKVERQNRAENISSTDTKSGKFKPFIDLILDLAAETGCFTDEQIRAETETIIAGGHDTVATVMTFTLAVLGSHSDIQEKAYKEIVNVQLGNLDKSIGKNDLKKLVYIEAVIKESLRLYVITAVIPRYIEEDVKLKNYTAKAHSDCYIFLHGLHRHSIWGPDADQFRPERWLDKETLPDPKYFGAFGLGRRACIGKSYAMMAMKIFLTYVVRKFVISSDISKMVNIIHVLIRPQSGYYITLTPRNK